MISFLVTNIKKQQFYNCCFLMYILSDYNYSLTTFLVIVVSFSLILNMYTPFTNDETSILFELEFIVSVLISFPEAS